MSATSNGYNGIGGFKWLAMISVIMLCAGCPGADSMKTDDARKGNIRMISNTYAMKFADARRSSFIAASSSSIGDLAWQIPLSDNKEMPFNPRAILVGGNQVFLYSQNMIISFNSDGIKLWTDKMWTGSPVSVSGNKIYYRKAGSINSLAAKTFGGMDDTLTMLILDSDDSAFPIFIEPLVNEFIALCICTIPPEQGPPWSKFYRKNYDTDIYNWVSDLKGRPPIVPLDIPELNRLIVFGGEEIAVYNSATRNLNGEMISHFPYPLDTILESSADASGNLYMIGTEEDKFVLVAMSLEGKKKWQYQAKDAFEPREVYQPPVIGANDNVYIIIASSLLALKNGESRWEFQAKGGDISFCTALADGTLLVTVANTLYRIGTDGRQIFRCDFNDRLVVPPVADSDGRIYVATSNTIARID